MREQLRPFDHGDRCGPWGSRCGMGCVPLVYLPASLRGVRMLFGMISLRRCIGTGRMRARHRALALVHPLGIGAASKSWASISFSTTSVALGFSRQAQPPKPCNLGYAVAAGVHFRLGYAVAVAAGTNYRLIAAVAAESIGEQGAVVHV